MGPIRPNVPTFRILIAVVERSREVLVHHAGRVAGVVGEYNAGRRQILSASLTTASRAATATCVQWQLLGHGARNGADARRGCARCATSSAMQ